MIVVAIDGPSGSGKSTVARTLAQRLNLPYLDTGAMCRSIALVALGQGLDLHDATKLEALAADTKLELIDTRTDGELRAQVIVDGFDATAEIRTPEVSQASSAIAVHPGVRTQLVNRQRAWVTERDGGVVEGRDIGTVVFPNATVKIFLTASHEERAKRRKTDVAAPGFEQLSTEQTKQEMAERDRRDSTRQTSPLAAAGDAVVIDTDGKDIATVVAEVEAALNHARKPAPADEPS